MHFYESRRIYKWFGIGVSATNILLQVFLLVRVFDFSVGIVGQIAALAVAYYVADLMSGLVHLYMDRKENYESWAGPLIANFHLHHQKLKYKNDNLFAVYFKETQSKVWLVVYLAGVVGLLFLPNVNAFVAYVAVYVGVLSSVAEVSHYLCHNSHSRMALFFSRIHLFLPKREHARHHQEDNVSYCFLNGMANPVVDWIAKKYSGGYANGTDKHYATFISAGGGGRV